MKKSEVNEEITLTNKLIQINKDKIEALEEKENTIQERYKKMMEEELAEIVREKTERLSTIETLEKMLSKDDVPVVDTKAEEKPVEAVEQLTSEPEQKTEEQPEDKKEEEPVIQDTLFPENNEPESEQEQNKNEQVESNEKKEDPKDEQPSDEVPFTPDEVLPNDNSGFVFNDDSTPDESGDSKDENWPSMPEEWQ